MAQTKRKSPRSKAEDVRVQFKARDGEVETAWCTTVDAAKHLYRVGSIPFMRPEPTHGDVIVATLDREGALTFRRIHERGGFRTSGLRYPRASMFRPLVAWLTESHGVETEGYVGPSRVSYGLLALAVPRGVSVDTILAEAVARFPGVTGAEETGELPRRPAPLEEALHDAIRRGDLRAVKRSLAAGAQLERRIGAPGDTALIVAGGKTSVPIVRALLAAGARVDAKNDLAQTAAHSAACRGNTAVFNVLVAAGARPVTRDKRGATGLMTAVLNGHTAMVKRLLALGATPNGRPNRFGATPLGGAAMRDRPEIAALLLAAGANPNRRDKHGFTPLMDAAYRGSTATARVLLAHGVAEGLGRALFVAAKEGHLPIVKMLVEAGADPAQRSPNGTTALALARKRKRADVVSYLTRRRAPKA